MHILSFHCSFGVLIFTFDMHVRITYLIRVIKNNGNNVRYTTKKNQTNVKQGIINTISSFRRNCKTFKNISFAVISLLYSYRKFTVWRKNFRQQKFYEIINQSEFWFCNIDQTALFKTLNYFANFFLETKEIKMGK